jgi:aprataxin
MDKSDRKHNAPGSSDAFVGAFKPPKATSSKKPAAEDTGRGGWSGALTRLAKSKDPKKDIPRDELLIHDKWTLAIFDKFPKAKFHFLVLPRIPFPLPQEGEDGYELFHLNGGAQQAGEESHDGERESKNPRLGLEGGKLTFGSTSGDTVPSSHLTDISALLKSPYAAYVLCKMRAMGKKVSRN